MSDSRRFLPYRRTLTPRARSLRRQSTPAERKLWYYIADFYCAAERLVIELDGGSHFTKQGEASDRDRTDVLGQSGIRVVRFTNLEVVEQFEGVCEKIRTTLREPS